MTTEVTIERLAKFNPLSSLNNSSLTQALDKIQTLQVRAGNDIFKKGSTENIHYYLLEGSIDLIADTRAIKTINSDSADADNPIAQVTPRPVTAKAKQDSILFTLDSDTLDMLLTWQQSSSYQVKEVNSESTTESDDWMLQLLRTEAFHRIPPANIQTIFMKMENVSVKPGEKIINQGDDGDYFYVIKEGRCLVTRSTPNQPTGIKLAELDDGDTFGEEALISNSKRNATVTMLTNGTLSRLSKSDFLELLNEPSLEKVTFEDAKKLVDTDNAAWIDTRLPSEFKLQNIKNSINIPLISLRLKINSLEEDKQYIVYCDTERRSSAASFLINESGRSSVVLIDGINSVPEEFRNQSN